MPTVLEKHCCSTIRKYVSILHQRTERLDKLRQWRDCMFCSFCFTLLCFVFASGMPRYKSQSQYNALCLVITVCVLVWLISRFCLQNSRKFARSTLSPLKLGDHSLLIIKCLSKQPERWSCWYTLVNSFHLIFFYVIFLYRMLIYILHYQLPLHISGIT